MATFEDFARLSPLPIVNLGHIKAPTSGIAINTPAVCIKHFQKGDLCRQHYERIANGGLNNQFIQCPYGFTSYAIRLNAVHVAFTGVVPFPRQGGAKEREVAKQCKENRISSSKYVDASLTLIELEKRIMALEMESTRRYSFALHEIRKLNRTIKQEAERLCLNQSPSQPDKADPSLVKIWKSAEMMSVQFDNIEFMADEHLFTLPLEQRTQFYRLVHKIVRIFQPHDRPSKILIDSPYGFDARILACDKTLQIIPTVLIENALKYSLPEEPIHVTLFREKSNVVLTVENSSKGRTLLTESIFRKGFRASADKEGSGNGLYLAKKVADQHRGILQVESHLNAPNVLLVRFRFIVPEAMPSH